MNYNDHILIKLLSDSIFDREPDIVIDQTVDWNYIYEEAKAHQIHTLIYPIAVKLKSAVKPDEKLMSIWNKDTISTVSGQLRNIEWFAQIFQKINEADIPFLVLKGLLLMNYYPYPELRTMRDADLLAHTEDIGKIKEILLTNGYIEGNISLKHHEYFHNEFYPIEVHRLLSEKVYSPDYNEAESMWENAVRCRLLNTIVYAPCTDDMLVHILLHMHDHMIQGGFGLRQLCDVVMLLKTEGHRIDWEKTDEKLKLYGIRYFAFAVFCVCNKLFYMEIPQIFKDLSAEASYIDLFTDDIIKAGVYGKKEPVRFASSKIIHYIDNKAFSSRILKLSGIISFLFPPAYKLNYKYRYAKKYPILLPFAWIHRIACNIGHKEFFLSQTEINAIGRERSRLFSWLQLH